MIKPLVLKIKENISLQSNKNQLLTVNDLISRFNIKSPSSQICLTDRSSSSTKSLSSSNNNHFFKRKSFNKPVSNGKQQCGGFRKVKMRTTTNPNKKPVLQLQKFGFERKQQKDLQTKSEKKIQLDLQFLKNKQEKSLVSKVVREIRSTIKVGKDNNHELAIAKKTTKTTEMKLQRPLTDRSQQKTNRFSQIIGKKDIFQSNNNKTVKFHQRKENINDFDIKMSNASTLSLKTKHTMSLQNFDDYEELFAKQECRNEKQPVKSLQSNYPTLTQLQKVKQKIYNQIYALDKKLLSQNIHQKSKKQITISLKRKDKIVQQKQESDNFSVTK